MKSLSCPDGLPIAYSDCFHSTFSLLSFFPFPRTDFLLSLLDASDWMTAISNTVSSSFLDGIFFPSVFPALNHSSIKEHEKAMFFFRWSLPNKNKQLKAAQRNSIRLDLSDRRHLTACIDCRFLANSRSRRIDVRDKGE